MDRTSRIGLVICFVFLIGIQFTLDKLYPPPPFKAKPGAAVATPSTASSTVLTPASGTHMSGEPGSTTTEPLAPAPVAEKISTIENDAMKVTFTSLGAAITEVELKKHKADNGGNIILNEQSHTNVMALSGWPGADAANFDTQLNGDDGITFTSDLPGGLKWQRTYTFGKEVENDTGMTGFLRIMFNKIAVAMGQPPAKPLVYNMDVADTLTNTAAADVVLPPYLLSVGRAEPLYDASETTSRQQSVNSNSQYLGSGWLTKTASRITTVNDFNPGFIPLIGIKTHEGRDEFSSKTIDPLPLRWIGVENQFFVMLLTPGSDIPINQGQFSCFNQRDDNGSILHTQVPDIEAAANFPGITVPAGKSIALNYSLYAGPKDFNRLDALGDNQGELLRYDGFLPFSLLIVPMLTILHFWFLVFHNYGVSIILLTLMIKAITWPLQSFANRSGKRVQAANQLPEMIKIKEKYKDQPEKLQPEIFALYKEYNVNMFGGCLPAFVQMPVFFSLYYMLQNAVELRGQSFLWVRDLTKPDTVFSLPFLFFGFHPALHPLPIMVTGLTMIMMRMTPQIGDPAQAKIAQFMPLVFLVIFYNFAAALSLYYVINNTVSIIQIYRNLRKPMPVLTRRLKK